MRTAGLSARGRQVSGPPSLWDGDDPADGARSASIAVSASSADGSRGLSEGSEGSRGRPGGAAGDPVGAPGELSDDDLAVFLDMSNEIFGVFDLAQGLIWSNGTAAALLGYGEQELARMSLVDLIHPEDLATGPGLVRPTPR